jgi:hypothetical protein
MVLWQGPPRLPGSLRQIPGWLLNRLRDRFVLLGLLPGAVIALVLIVPWYITTGVELLDIVQRLSDPELAELRGMARLSIGFPEARSLFWWYAQTAPGALSNVLAGSAVIGLIHALWRRRQPGLVLALILVASYFTLSREAASRVWWNFALVLPIVACLSAGWLVDLRRRWLAVTLSAVCAAVAVLNFSVVTWGISPWSRPLAIALGSPLMDNETCRSRVTAALCPAPAQPVDEWPTQEILRQILKDPQCREGHPCRLMVVHSHYGIWRRRLEYYMARDRLHSKLEIVKTGGRIYAHPYNLPGLLNSEYILYPDLRRIGMDGTYLTVSIYFLRSPPDLFRAAHETVASYECPQLTFKLVRRIKPLTIAEAEVSITALQLDDRLKSRQYEVLIPLHLEQGRIREALALYDQMPHGRRRRATIRARLIQECEARGRSEEAMPLYQEILEKDPDNHAARTALDRLRAREPRKRP